MHQPHGKSPPQADSKARAASRVTVELREDDTREVDAVLERLSRRHRVLTDHRVEHEEDLVRTSRITNGTRLFHQGFVNTQSTGGVDDDGVELLLFRELDTVLRNSDRVSFSIARLRGENRHPRLLCDNRQLRDRVGAL